MKYSDEKRTCTYETPELGNHKINLKRKTPDLANYSNLLSRKNSCYAVGVVEKFALLRPG